MNATLASLSLLRLFLNDTESFKNKEVHYVNTVRCEISVNNTLISGIKHFEGFRSTSYVCAGGVKTIGYGFTGDECKASSISEVDASYILETKVIPAYSKVVDSIVTVPLTPYQKSALISFTYNCGENNLRRLVNGHNRLNSGNYESVTKILPLYRRANGKVLDGLVKRRNWEVELFQGNLNTL